MNAFVFAAGLDWLEALLPFLFVLVGIVSQVVNVFRNVAGRGKPQPPAPPRRPRPPVDRVDDMRVDLERQIGEFLKERAQPRREPPPKPVRMPPQRKPAPRSQPAAEAHAERPTTPSRLGSLGDHGADVAKHVRDAFAHDLEHRTSQLAKPVAAGESAAAGPAPATHELVALVRDPNSLRRLFLVREVLDRPTERWE